MPEFTVDFADARPNDTLVLHDTSVRKRAIAIGASVRCIDAAGNTCRATVAAFDTATRLLTVMLDRSSYTSSTI